MTLATKPFPCCRRLSSVDVLPPPGCPCSEINTGRLSRSKSRQHLFIILVLILIGILAAGGAFIIPNITSEISLKGENASGSALGIQKSIDGLGQTIGPILGSWLLNINPSLPYLLTGTSLLIISLLLFKFQ